jgi:hypothetical protein
MKIYTLLLIWNQVGSCSFFTLHFPFCTWHSLFQAPLPFSLRTPRQLLLSRKLRLFRYRNTPIIVDLHWKWRRQTGHDTENFTDSYRNPYIFNLFFFIWFPFKSTRSPAGQAKGRVSGPGHWLPHFIIVITTFFDSEQQTKASIAIAKVSSKVMILKSFAGSLTKIWVICLPALHSGLFWYPVHSGSLLYYPRSSQKSVLSSSQSQCGSHAKLTFETPCQLPSIYTTAKFREKYFSRNGT